LSRTLAMALADLDEGTVLTEVKQRLDAGVPALKLFEELQKGMETVGERYEAKEYYLSELIMAADVFKSASAILGDEIQPGTGETLGTMVLGTVFEDIHDIGKNIVAVVLSCNGIKVIDLGVNVPVAQFVEAVREHKPQLVGLSCLLTTAYDNMKATVEALEAAGLRGGVKVLVGGGPVDRGTCEYAKADAVCKNAQEAVDTAKKMLGVK
jgi:dimethylamine corrinoid protein